MILISLVIGGNGRSDTYIKDRAVVNFDEDSPVHTDVTDSQYFYDNQDAVSIKIPKRGKKNNN